MKQCSLIITLVLIPVRIIGTEGETQYRSESIMQQGVKIHTKVNTKVFHGIVNQKTQTGEHQVKNETPVVTPRGIE